MTVWGEPPAPSLHETLIWTIFPEYTVLIQVVKLITQNEEHHIQAIMRLNQTSAVYLVLSGRG